MGMLTRLYLLVLLAVLPALGFLAYAGHEARNAAAAQIEKDAQRYAHLVSAELDRIVEGIHNLLIAVSEVDAVRLLDAEPCSRHVAALERRHPGLTSITAIDLNGRLVCRSTPAPPELSVADRPYFKEAVAQRALVIDRYTRRRTTGEATLPLALSFDGPDGRPAGIVATAIDLDWLHRHFAAKIGIFPPQTAISVLDRDGIVLLRLPNRELEGKAAPERLRWLLTAEQGGTFTASATETSDHVDRVVAFTSLKEPPGNLLVAVGLSQDLASAALRRQTLYGLATVSLGALLAFVAAWIGGRIFILRPIAALAAAAERWRVGDFLARSGLGGQRSEIGRLGAAFDAMAEELGRSSSALRTREGQLRQALEAADLAEWDLDYRTKCLAPSPRLNKMLGYPAEQPLSTQHLRDRYHPEDLKLIRTYRDEQDADPLIRTVEREFRIVRPDGSVRWLLGRGELIRDEAGKVVRSLGVLLDVTERKRVEMALRASEARLKRAQEAGGIGDWAWDLASGAVTWSDSLYRLLDLSPATFTPSVANFVGLIHPEDREQAKAAAGAAIRGDRSLDTTFRVVLPDGSVRWLASRGEVERDANGTPRRLVGVNFDITERHKAQAAVHESRARLQLVLDSLSEAVAAIFPDQAAPLRNRAWLRFHGFAGFDELPGLQFADVQPLFELRDAAGTRVPVGEYPLERAMRGESFENLELRMRRTDTGLERWGSYNGISVRGDDGTIVLALISIRDITDRVAAEAALRTSEARFRAIVEDQTEFISRFTPDFTITYVNQAYATQLGRTAEAMIGTSLLALMNDRQRAQFTRQLAALTPDSPTVSYEMDTVLPDGSTGWEQWTDRALFDPTGRLVEYQSVGRDVTQRRRAEEELRRNEARFRTVLTGSPIFLYEMDIDLRFRWVCNPPPPLSPEEWIGRRDDEIDPLDHAVRRMALKRRVIETGIGLREEVTHQIGDVVHTYDLTLEPKRDAAGRVVGLTGAALDITERKRAEERQRLLLRELSHRVKNMLATVQVIARRSLGGGRSLDEAREALIERLRALARTHDLLTASEWRGVSLQALIEDTLAPYGRRAELAGPYLVLAPTAAQTLGLVLHELATNAAKHGALSVPEGRVAVAWQVEHGPAGDCFRLDWRESNGPTVRPPTRQGFGRTLIEHAVAHELRGKVRLDFAPAGLGYALEAPYALVATERRKPPPV